MNIDYELLKNKLKGKGLSNREIEVALCVLDYDSHREIGEKLGIGEKGVKFHLTFIYKKLKLKSKYQLLYWFFKQMKNAHKVEGVTEEKQALKVEEITEEVTLPKSKSFSLMH